jgi:hypothetical protein
MTKVRSKHFEASVLEISADWTDIFEKIKVMELEQVSSQTNKCRGKCD